MPSLTRHATTTKYFAFEPPTQHQAAYAKSKPNRGTHPRAPTLLVIYGSNFHRRYNFHVTVTGGSLTSMEATRVTSMKASCPHRSDLTSMEVNAELNFRGSSFDFHASYRICQLIIMWETPPTRQHTDTQTTSRGRVQEQTWPTPPPVSAQTHSPQLNEVKVVPQ